MGKMGYGYGSEWQLTRFLGRHRETFTRRVADECGLKRIEWLDFEFRAANWLGDGELLGLDFLPDEGVKAAFREWWPHGSGIMNWDAVGRGADTQGRPSWVLVEAKGNLPEIESSCGAGPKSLERIRYAFDETRRAFGILESEDWIVGHYQYANRLAVLHFLTRMEVDAHLVNLYFCGHTTSDSRSPLDASAWGDALTRMKVHLGLTGTSALEARVQEIFIDVSGAT